MDVSGMRVTATLDKLAPLIAFAVEELEGQAQPMAAMALSTKLELVLEELLVNVISYAYQGGEGEVELLCTRCEEADSAFVFCMEIRDRGLPFDPTAKEAPDTKASMDDRDIGGLGIHLVQQMTSSFSYERQEDMNITRFCLQHP